MLALLLSALLLAPNVQTDVVYRKVDGVELKMDVYSPETPAAQALPAVVVVHGGAWIGGKRSDIKALAAALASEGMVAATVDYRLAPKHKWPAMLDDVQSAVRYLRANNLRYRIDPLRIGATGASAGGHLALLLGMRETRDRETDFYPRVSSRVAAVLNLFGPTDLAHDFAPGTADFLAIQVVGKSFKQAETEIRDFSPVNFVDGKTAPIFTIQGQADPMVPPYQADRLDQALKAANRPHVLVKVPGMVHDVDIKKPAERDALKKGIEFLKSTLKRRVEAPKAAA